MSNLHKILLKGNNICVQSVKKNFIIIIILEYYYEIRVTFRLSVIIFVTVKLYIG